MPNAARARRALRTVLGAAFAGAGGTWAMEAWVRRQAAPHLFFHIDQLPARSTAIVPGARVYRSGEPSAVLTDRLEMARRLHEAGLARHILVSGDRAAAEHDEPEAMRRWLVARGVASEAIRTDGGGVRTRDTMERAAGQFRVHDAIVCTQRFHLARSVFLARRAGIDAVGVAADLQRYRRGWRFSVREVPARVRAFWDSYVSPPGDGLG